MHPLLVLLIGFGVVIGGIAWLRLHAFLALVLGALTVALITQPSEAGSMLAAGLGKMVGNIGIVIAMAAIIGKCLLDSGAAERIVVAIRGWFGDRRLSSAFASSSFFLGIPVFFDTVFYLLMPIGRATAKQTGRNYLLYTLSIVAGATMAHSLVPPTPGPLLVAGRLNVTFLEMVIGGLIVGVITVTAGLAYARWANRRWDIPLRDTDMEEPVQPEALSGHPRTLPPLWLSVMPIVLPLILLAGDTVVDALFRFGKGENPFVPAWARALETVGDKNVALIIAALVSLVLLVTQRKGVDAAKAVQNALASGGVIILITAAGGAFGEVIEKSSGFVEWIKGVAPEGKLMILPMAFLITTLVRIAQGSATVAMITAVQVVGGLAEALPYHAVYLALAIGCGSKPIPWLNDSGFWIISRMSGMTTVETLKTASTMMSLMGLVGLPVVMLGAWLLPLV